MTGWSLDGRWWNPATITVICIGTVSCFLSGCSLPAQQAEQETKNFVIPTVKVPLLKVPLTNRFHTDTVLEHFKPEPDALPCSKSW